MKSLIFSQDLRVQRNLIGYHDGLLNEISCDLALKRVGEVFCSYRELIFVLKELVKCS